MGEKLSITASKYYILVKGSNGESKIFHNDHSYEKNIFFEKYTIEVVSIEGDLHKFYLKIRPFSSENNREENVFFGDHCIKDIKTEIAWFEGDLEESDTEDGKLNCNKFGNKSVEKGGVSCFSIEKDGLFDFCSKFGLYEYLKEKIFHNPNESLQAYFLNNFKKLLLVEAESKSKTNCKDTPLSFVAEKNPVEFAKIICSMLLLFERTGEVYECSFDVIYKKINSLLVYNHGEKGYHNVIFCLYFSSNPGDFFEYLSRFLIKELDKQLVHSVWSIDQKKKFFDLFLFLPCKGKESLGYNNPNISRLLKVEKQKIITNIYNFFLRDIGFSDDEEVLKKNSQLIEILNTKVNYFVPCSFLFKLKIREQKKQIIADIISFKSRGTGRKDNQGDLDLVKEVKDIASRIMYIAAEGNVMDDIMNQIFYAIIETKTKEDILAIAVQLYKKSEVYENKFSEYQKTMGEKLIARCNDNLMTLRFSNEKIKVFFNFSLNYDIYFNYLK